MGGNPLNITLVIYNKASINGFPLFVIFLCVHQGVGVRWRGGGGGGIFIHIAIGEGSAV